MLNLRGLSNLGLVSVAVIVFCLGFLTCSRTSRPDALAAGPAAEAGLPPVAVRSRAEQLMEHHEQLHLDRERQLHDRETRLQEREQLLHELQKEHLQKAAKPAPAQPHEEKLPVAAKKKPAAVQQPQPPDSKKPAPKGVDDDTRIHTAFVVCGDRLKETMVLIKSILFFTRSPITFHMFLDQENHALMAKLVAEYTSAYPHADFNVLRTKFPENNGQGNWEKLFKPCASQRLFLPALLTDVQRIIYFDTDIIAIDNVANLWEFFPSFNETQFAAMVQEGEVPQINWYARHARHPFYGKHGLNSGIMLMDLSRMRKAAWMDEMSRIYKQWMGAITWGDQDILNVYFHDHPETFYANISCEWNFRPDHCQYSLNCANVRSNGVHFMHGNRRVFFNQADTPDVRNINIQPSFKELFDLIDGKPLGGRVSAGEVLSYIQRVQGTACGEEAKSFFAPLQAYLKE